MPCLPSSPARSRGGWEPAPYDAEMVADGGHVLVNEASLWPSGQFVTTELVVTQGFLAAHPTVVDRPAKRPDRGELLHRQQQVGR